MVLKTRLVITFIMLTTTTIAFATAAIKTTIPARSILPLHPKVGKFMATKEGCTDFVVPINLIKNPLFIKHDYSKDFNQLDTVQYFIIRTDVKLVNYDKNKNSYIFRIQPREEIILVKLIKEIGNPILDYTVKQIKADIYFGDGKKYLDVSGYFKHLPTDFYHGLKYRKDFNYKETIITSIDTSDGIKMVTTQDIPISINLHD